MKKISHAASELKTSHKAAATAQAFEPSSTTSLIGKLRLSNKSSTETFTLIQTV